MPKVLNKHIDKIPADAIYIGRPSKWGNPFQITERSNRECVVNLFRQLVESNDEFKLQIKNELAGKDLVCFCAPKMCHGDVLLEIANSK